MSSRSHLIRLASSLPKGHARRRSILAQLMQEAPTASSKKAQQDKTALQGSTEAFIEWVLLTQKPMTPAAVERFLETKLGREPTQPTPRAAPRKGPLVVGEGVMVDKTKNTNPVNVDACETYHNRAGTVESVSDEGVTIAFYKGDALKATNELSGDKQYFDGLTTGKDSGLYRWSPNNYAENAEKKILFEVVYTKDENTKVDTRSVELVQKYVDMGDQKGENRSRVYYTGYVNAFAYGKDGTMYFGMAAQQREGRPTIINPSKGKVLYIGIAGKRPGGWISAAQDLGLDV